MRLAKAPAGMTETFCWGPDKVQSGQKWGVGGGACGGARGSLLTKKSSSSSCHVAIPCRIPTQKVQAK